MTVGGAARRTAGLAAPAPTAPASRATGPLGRHLATCRVSRRRAAALAFVAAAVAAALTAWASALPIAAAVLVGWPALAAALVAVGQVLAVVDPCRIEIYQVGAVRRQGRDRHLTLF